MTREEFEAAAGAPLSAFAAQCHAASIALVKSGALGEARVARGFAPGVMGQHSWVIVGTDCYDPHARVVDPTLWSYTREEPYVWEGIASELPHLPHGAGVDLEWGRPDFPTGEVISLAVEWSPAARMFLNMVGPLDLDGWRALAHAPVGGWPAGEIIGAMYDDPRLSVLIPIDIVGMVTDRNPHGLYLRG